MEHVETRTTGEASVSVELSVDSEQLLVLAAL